MLSANPGVANKRLNEGLYIYIYIYVIIYTLTYTSDFLLPLLR